MFPYRATEPNTLGQVTRWDIPLNRWLDVKFEQGLNDRGGAAIGRMMEDFFADGPEIAPEEANERYGLPGLKFDSPIKEERARLMHERKRSELTRMAYMEAAEHSPVSFKGIAGFGAQMVGSMLHPVDVGLMFVPIVGSSAKAGGIAKLGGGAIRQGLARGLITREALETAVRFPQFTAAFIEGSVGNAIAEIPLFIQNMRDQAVYGPQDSAVNILAGGLFASGIRLTISSLGKALEAAAFVHRSLTLETRQNMFLKAVDDHARGKDIRVEDFVRVDDNVINQKVQFDSVRATEEAETAIGETVLLRELPPETQERIYQEYKQRGSHETFEDFVAARAEQPVVMRDGTEPVIEAGPEPSDPKMAIERQAVIQDMVDVERKKFEAQKESLVEVERQAEVQRQIAQGKILPDEEVERVKLKGETADSTDAAIIGEDIASIEQELKADTQRRVQELTPEEREAVQKQLDDELGQVDEKAYKPRDKAIEAAIPCVMQGAIDA